MGGYQQGTHNVVYPFQQQSEASSGRYTAASQSSSSQPVEQNYYYHQQQQPQQSPPPLACSPQPLTQQVQHTLIPTRQHAKISSLQEKQPEVTPSDVASQTQSEPPGYPSSFPDTPCATREGSVAPATDADSALHRSELGTDVARVAPVSATSTSVVGIQRHEETSRSQDHVPVAVAQVAPLRPEPESLQNAPIPVTQAPATQVTIPNEAAVAGASDPEPVDSPGTAATINDVPVHTDDPNVSVALSLPAEPSNRSQQTVQSPHATPEPTSAETVLSPVGIQATSTPNAVGDTKTVRSSEIRAENQNRESSSREPEDSHGQVNAHSGLAAAAEQSDSTTGSLSTRNGPERRSVQSRYRKFKEHFSGIMGRLDQYRAEPPRSEFRSSSRTGNPLMANAANSLGRRSVLAVAKNSNAQGRSLDSNLLYNSKSEEGNVSLFSQPDPRLDMSFDSNRPAVVYGDDFVDAARRSRLSRLSRPNSRAKADFNEAGEQFEPRIYSGPASKPYPGHYPSGRRSVHGSTGVSNAQEYYVQQSRMYKERRRPQSSYDARAMERFQRAGGRYGYYDVYDDPHSSVSEESDSDDPDRGDSEEEMRKYTRKARYAGDVDPFTIGEEMYYFGAIHLDQARVRSILVNDPPPPEYHRLPPIEKAAYLFYVAVYKKQYSDLTDFHRKFNREYFKYSCDGDADNIALWKICKSMQEEYLTKKLSESQKAYEASQRQLFSDERESVDGKDQDFVPLGDNPRRLLLRTNSAPVFMSERASMDENHDDRTSDILSIESSQRAPLKHRVPHAFVTFGYGGKMVTVHPDLSVSVVQIDDVKTVFSDPHTMRLIDTAQTFKGPLLIGQTPTHSVRLYIERQIKRIKSCEVASENPRDNDVIDCLLIWQLLGMIVQQQGRVTGPDLARLLVEIGNAPSRAAPPSHQHHSHREKSSTPAENSGVSGPVTSLKSQSCMDARAYDRFTDLLLGGHITEAIESALRDGLYADAMVVARRLLSNDPAKLIEIEERFLATRPQCNPVVTLVSVATKKHVPILMNPTGDDSGCWRTHAAIVLANLSTQEAMESVYDLGKVLAKRDYNCAADFCFLAVAVLAGVNPFKTLEANPDDGVSRQHITLIHGGLPDDDFESVQCRYGFSLTDLHATEIFDYAIRLSDVNAYSPLGDSIDYQKRRIQYAQLIAEFGGFATDAFRYCMEIARSIWNYYHLFSVQELTDLCDLADRLKFAASASDYETSWIASLRAMIQQKQQCQPSEVPQSDSAAAEKSIPPTAVQPLCDSTQAGRQQSDVSAADNAVTAPEPELSASRRSRSESLAAEARDWHAQRQDPLQMSPVAPMQSAVAAAVEDSDVPVSRSRTQSNTSQQRYTMEPCSNEAYMPPTIPQQVVTQRKGSMDEAFSNSDDASARSTSESTPVRTVNQYAENTPAPSQPLPDLSHIPQMPVPPSLPQTITQPAQPHSQTQPQPQPQSHTASSAQPNGSLVDSHLKKSSSSSKGFFGNMKEKLLKAIPSGSEMILPDDSQPSIVWDPVKGRYVGAGVEEETTSAPPPKLDSLSANSSSGGLRAARTSGGSRYFNPLNQASTNGAATPPPAPVPAMPLPTQFGFIPTMPEDSGDSVDPFSGQANPTIQGIDASPAQ